MGRGKREEKIKDNNKNIILYTNKNQTKDKDRAQEEELLPFFSEKCTPAGRQIERAPES